MSALLLFLAHDAARVGGVEELLHLVPQVHPLLVSPDFLPSLAAMVAVSALELAGINQANSSSSSSRSGSSTWRSSKQLELELSPAQL